MLIEAMLIRAFFNARHSVSGQAGPGSIHTHSWMVEVEVSLTLDESDSYRVGFSEVEQSVQAVVGAFEDRFLNEMPTFAGRQPTTETLCSVIFDSLLEVCNRPGVMLRAVTLWESPTKGITVGVPYFLTRATRPQIAGVSPAPSSAASTASSRSVPYVATESPVAESPATKLPAELPAPTPVEAAGAARCSPSPSAEIIEPEAEATQVPTRSRWQGRAKRCKAFPVPIRRRRGAHAAGTHPYVGKHAAEPKEDPGGTRGPELVGRAGRRAVRSRPVYLMAAAASILIVALAVYMPILRAVPGYNCPWGSDTWGHLLKAEFLYQQMKAGDFYPQYFAGWYSGVQPFRYWSPLPYYVLAAWRWLVHDIFLAGYLYVFAAAAFGGLSWLAYRRYVGLEGATICGVLWTMWGDHIRVAMSEGNLPRVLTTALLPLTGYLFLRLLDGDMRPLVIAGCALVFVGLVLTHAMMAAITALSLAFFGLLYVWYRGTSLRAWAKAVSVIGAGILLSGWWLFPSLIGGIVAIDPQAAAQAATFTPFVVAFNPLIRRSNPELFYWGASLIVVTLAVVATWRHRPPYARAALTWGISAVAFSLPAFRFIHDSLPLGNVLWPERFASAAALAFLLAAFGRSPQAGRSGSRSVTRWAAAAAVTLALLLDMSGSLRLVGARPPAVDTLRVSRDLAALPGWRVATIDLSQLGSAPSYWFDERAGREQVFGWAWQGAATAPNLVWINTAILTHRYGFALDRLVEMGATDLV
ncbi:MAG TPA: hypothetical protein GX513_12165, partial [Firmicutes bacterium]|nr:hypothetical protein [Bacillota bacterium]